MNVYMMKFKFSDNNYDYVLTLFKDKSISLIIKGFNDEFGRTCIFQLEYNKINWDNGWQPVIIPEHVRNYFDRAIKLQAFI